MKFQFIPVLILALGTIPVDAAVRDEIPAKPAVQAPAKEKSGKDSIPAEAVSRGQLLYQNHCTRCHTSVVHVREKRRANSLPALEGWVRRWSGEEKLGWNGEEIAEVVNYLNRRYYKFPSPGGGK